MQYEADELTAIRLFREHGSESAAGYKEMGQTQNVIREVLSESTGSRTKRVVFRSIICATRFKFFEGGGLLPTTCMRCGVVGSLEHLMECAGIQVPLQSGDPDPTVEFLAVPTREACRIHTGVPAPFRERTEEEIVLSARTPSAGSDDGGGATGEVVELSVAVSGDSKQKSGET